MGKIGRYTVRDRLGQGSMADVFSVWDPERDKEVALKLLLSKHVKNRQIRRRFAREAAAIKRLNHAAIIPIYDFAEDGNNVYYTMPVLHGGTLADRLSELGHPMDGQQILFILERIATAVDYIHAQDVIHRDIKPSNILFNQHGQPHLADFSVMQLPLSRITEMGDRPFIGTPAYASPEQISLQEIDPRSDLYSLGVVLFEMLTRTLPYKSADWRETSQMHISQRIPSVQARLASIDPRWQRVIDKALAKKPGDRYQSGQEMIVAVRGVVEGHPETVIEATTAIEATWVEEPIRERTKSWRAIAPALLGVFLLLFAGIYLLLNEQLDQTRTTHDPKIPFQNVPRGNIDLNEENLVTSAPIEFVPPTPTNTLTPTYTPIPTITPTPALNESWEAGFRIRIVATRSITEQSGLQVDDFIVGIDDKKFETAEEIDNLIAEKRPEDETVVWIIRGLGNEPEPYLVALDEHPDDPSRGILGINTEETRFSRSLIQSPPPIIFDPNVTFQYVIGRGKGQAQFEADEEAHYWMFELDQKWSLEIFMMHSSLTTQLVVVDGVGNSIDEKIVDRIVGSAPKSQSIYTTLEPGIYYIRVDKIGADTGTYTVKIGWIEAVSN